MTALAVETTNLSKSYGDQPALHRVDLRVPEGSVYVLPQKKHSSHHHRASEVT